MSRWGWPGTWARIETRLGGARGGAVTALPRCQNHVEPPKAARPTTPATIMRTGTLGAAWAAAHVSAMLSGRLGLSGDGAGDAWGSSCSEEAQGWAPSVTTAGRTG